MTIDPELLRQIQVEGITDDDYRRVEPKIETIKQMAALSTEGMFIFDLFKMDYHYIAPNTFCSNSFMQQDLLDRRLSIFETRITAYGQQLIWMATASLQRFFKSAGHKLRDDYIVHFNCAKLVLSPYISMSTYAKPLAFAPDGRAWLVQENIYTAPEHRGDTICIHNTKTGEILVYDPNTDRWINKTFAPLSPMEKAILLLMAQGKSVKDIADSLNKSEDTIRSHQKALFKKLGAHTAIEAVGIAKKYGLIRHWLY